MQPTITFDKLIRQLCIPITQTRVQENELVSKYEGTIVEFDYGIINDIDINNGIHLHYKSPETNENLYINFKAQDLNEMQLNKFSKGDYVLIIAQLYFFNYLSLASYNSEVKYPHKYGFNLISISRREQPNEKELINSLEKQAKSAGIWGAIKYIIGYGIGGIIAAGIIEIFAGEIVGIIIFFVITGIGGFIGYSEAYQNKRERLRLK